MLDFKALVLDPIHDLMHPMATVTLKSGETIHCTASDFRDGVTICAARGKDSVMKPGVVRQDCVVRVRQSDCPEKPVGGTIRFDGETQVYTIKMVKQRGSPGRGEWELELEAV